MSSARIVLCGEEPDPDHELSWTGRCDAFPDEGDIVEIAAPVPDTPCVYDPRNVLSLAVKHRIWHVDGSVSLVCTRMFTFKRAA